MAIKIFRLNELLPLRGVSRSTHYLELSRGLWTRPIRLSIRSRGWPAYEVEGNRPAKSSTGVGLLA